MLYNTLLSLTKYNPVLPKIVQQKEGPFVSIGRKTYESMGIKIEEEFDGLFYKVHLPINSKIVDLDLIIGDEHIGYIETDQLPDGTITGAKFIFY